MHFFCEVFNKFRSFVFFIRNPTKFTKFEMQELLNYADFWSVKITCLPVKRPFILAQQDFLTKTPPIALKGQPLQEVLFLSLFNDLWTFWKLSNSKMYPPFRLIPKATHCASFRNFLKTIAFEVEDVRLLNSSL